MARRKPFDIAGVTVPPGTRRTVEVRVSELSDHTPVHLSVRVVHGRKPGPVMFVSAAVHGDEVIGAEIVRRLLNSKALTPLAGTLLAVPIVNTFGFLNHSRYLPDRRDLNRCFPGHATGSMASRLAHIFMTEVVKRCDLGIDLHSAAIRRTNLPQLRLTAGNDRLRDLADVFAAPVVMPSNLRDGSLRMAAEDAGVDVLLYEAGEGLRFDEFAARTGVAGILRMMSHLGMISGKGVPRKRAEPLYCTESTWYRAPAGGLLRGYLTTGDTVEQGTVMGAISDPFGEFEAEVIADQQGIIIGRTNMPVVYEGDALFHVAQTSSPEDVARGITAHMAPMPMFDEDEII